MSGYHKTTDAERRLMQHVSMWGSDGYPVQKIGRRWQWVEFFGVKGSPIVYRTKREAVAAFEGWRDQMVARLGEESRERALAEMQSAPD